MFEDVIVYLFLLLRDVYPPTDTSIPICKGWMVVSHVCRRWRYIALSTASLWTRIDPRLGSLWAYLFIGRSRSALISLETSSMPISYRTASVISDVLKLASERISHLRLNALSSDEATHLSPVLEGIRDTLNRNHFPSLTQLNVKEWSACGIRTPEAGRFPALRRLWIGVDDLVGWDVDWSMFPGELDEIFISNGAFPQGKVLTLNDSSTQLGGSAWKDRAEALLCWLSRAGVRRLKKIELGSRLSQMFARSIVRRRLPADILEELTISGECEDVTAVLCAVETHVPVRRIEVWITRKDAKQLPDLLQQVWRLSKVRKNEQAIRTRATRAEVLGLVRLSAVDCGSFVDAGSHIESDGHPGSVDIYVGVSVLTDARFFLEYKEVLVDWIKTTSSRALSTICFVDIDLGCEDWKEYLLPATCVRNLEVHNLSHPPSILQALSSSSPDQVGIRGDRVLLPSLRDMTLVAAGVTPELLKLTSRIVVDRVRLNLDSFCLSLRDCTSLLTPRQEIFLSDIELEILDATKAGELLIVEKEGEVQRSSQPDRKYCALRMKHPLLTHPT